MPCSLMNLRFSIMLIWYLVRYRLSRSFNRLQGNFRTHSKTEPVLSRANHSVFHEGTILTAWPAAAAVPLSKSLLLKVVFHRQITNTDSAVSSYFLSSCYFFTRLYSLVYSHQHILLFILLFFKI